MIKPALTPEEWFFWRARVGGNPLGTAMDWDDMLGAHAACAMRMDGQPWGFTWEDVDAVRAAAKMLQHESHTRAISEQADRAEAVAARIAALLSPRES